MWGDYLDFILIGIVIAFGWMVYRLVMKGQEFREKWEDLPEESKIFIKERYRYPFLRVIWNMLRVDKDIILSGIMIIVMIVVLLWIL